VKCECSQWRVMRMPLGGRFKITKVI
jgi:hypothetical protein